MSDINFKVNEDFDFTIDEKGNSYIALRKISWNDRPEKLDLRKYFVNSEGEEVMGKGLAFITEDGPNILVETLLEQGYGDTEKVLRTVSKRDNFVQCIDIIKNDDEDNDEINHLDELF